MRRRGNHARSAEHPHPDPPLCDAEMGLQVCTTGDIDAHSHIWLQPRHFCALAAAGVRCGLASGSLDTSALLPRGPPARRTPLISHLTDIARALLLPAYGEEAAVLFAHRAAALIATNAADSDSALVLMHGGADLRAVVEDVVEALVLSGTAASDGGEPAVESGVSRLYVQCPAARVSPAAQASSDSFRRSRDIPRYLRESYLQKQGRARGEHSGRSPAPRNPEAGYGNAAAGRSVPIITPQTLFTGAARAARVSLDAEQVRGCLFAVR